MRYEKSPSVLLRRIILDLELGLGCEVVSSITDHFLPTTFSRLDTALGPRPSIPGAPFHSIKSECYKRSLASLLVSPSTQTPLLALSYHYDLPRTTTAISLHLPLLHRQLFQLAIPYDGYFVDGLFSRLSSSYCATVARPYTQKERSASR